ncbi:putative FMRFamide-like neuropeptide [Dirofilaria immitis]
MNPFTIIVILFFGVSICYIQAYAFISDQSECRSNICWHEKRSNEKYKAIRFIRSHLGIMRFGKRSAAAKFGTIRFNKRIDLNDFLHASAIMQQNDESRSIDSNNDYSNFYGKVSY